MKLFGVTDGKYVIFSAGHYDCRTKNNMMIDGGQPGLVDYAGYYRASGKPIWFDLPNVTFDKIYQDYLFTREGKRRKYGIHKVSSVVLDVPAPNIESFYRKKENHIWISRGNGKSKVILLQDASTEHLKNILNLNISRETEEIIKSILSDREIGLE